MKIEWSPEAAADFAGIVDYIHKQNPAAADRVARAFYDSAALHRIVLLSRPTEHGR
jgi:plasmid stabilization system protein ParE